MSPRKDSSAAGFAAPFPGLSLFAALSLSLAGATAGFAGETGLDRDCNENGRPDAEEVQAGDALDCNGNGIPDECDLRPSLEAPELPVSLPVRAERDSGEYVTVIDLDGESPLDLVSPAHPGELAIFLGRGEGRFEESRVELGIDSGPLLAVDLDADGDMDLAGGGPYLLENLGAGRLRGPMSVPAKRPGALSAAGDLDGDGLPELITSRSLSRVFSVFPNLLEKPAADPDPESARLSPRAFGKPVVYPTEGQPCSMGVADLTGDGAADVVVAADDPEEVVLFANDGSGNLDPLRRVSVPDEPVDLAIADFDLDGYEDLVTVSRETRELTWLRNLGGGVLAVAGSVEVADRFGSLEHVHAAALDGNDAPDLVVAGYPFGLSVFLNDGGGPLAARRADLPAGWVLDLDSGDLDGDGDSDIVLGIQSSKSLSIIRNGGSGRLIAMSTVPIGEDPRGAVLADLDADGDLDLAAVSHKSENVEVYANEGVTPDGEVRFAEPRTIRGFPSPGGLAAGDFDGDGNLDLSVGTSKWIGGSAKLTIHVGDGALGFREGFSQEFERAPPGMFPVDIDRDGHVDLVVTGGEGNRVSLMRNAGDGTFDEPVHLEGGHREISGDVVIEDLDGDSRPDVAAAVRNGNDALPGAVDVFLQRPDGTFGTPARVEAPPGTRSISAADVDRDGDLDLAVAAFISFTPGAIVVFENDGDGKFSVVQPLATQSSRGPLTVEFVDWDEDGAPDLVTGNASGDVSLWLNRGGELVPSGVIPFGEGPVPLGIEDLGVGRELIVLNRLSEEVGHLPLGDVTAPPVSSDCDLDGVPDECGTLVDCDLDGRFDACQIVDDPRADSDGDGILDACQAVFHRGDANGDGRYDLSDVIFLLSALFVGGPSPGCADAADANNDGRLDVSDAGFSLFFFFIGGDPPASPGPPRESCGPDTEPPGRPGHLGCERYESCDS